MTITNRLAEIEARAKSATPGPWKARHQEEHLFGATNIVTAFEITAPLVDACWVAKVQNHRDCIATKPGPENADFIAHARTDIPRLTAALRVAVEEFDQFGGPWAEEVLTRIEAALKEKG